MLTLNTGNTMFMKVFGVLCPILYIYSCKNVKKQTLGLICLQLTKTFSPEKTPGTLSGSRRAGMRWFITQVSK